MDLFLGTDDEDESTESEDRGENGGEGDDIECRGGNEMWEASASYAGASAELETKVEELTLIKDATGVEDSFNEAVPSGMYVDTSPSFKVINRNNSVIL